ncbi:MAG: peptidylprolyl isomerase [Isosphaeraceae bacterium]
MASVRLMTSITLLSVAVLGVGITLSTSAAAGQAAGQNPVVVLDTSEGPITIELYPDKAPITVENFLKYVDEKFYDNLIFHRVIRGFMIQGGGLTDQMQEKPAHAPIKNESSTGGISNERGTIAMARMNDPDSATCQFFINHQDNKRLDHFRGGYTAFGKVISGMDVVDKIANVATTTKASQDDVPIKPVYIKSARRKTK